MPLPKHKIDNIRTKLRNLEKSGKEIVFDVTFLKGNTKDKLIEHATPKSKAFASINKLLDYDDYEALKIDFYDLKNNPAKPYSTEKIVLSKPDELGEIEVSKFEKYIQEREKEKAYAQMQENLAGLEEDNNDLETLVEQQKQEIEELQEQLKSKSNFQHYAGMVGEILGKIGVKSEKLNALTGLFGIDDFQPLETTQALTGGTQDHSGIVEEKNQPTQESQALSPDDQKKIELIQLMVDFLYNLDLKTLGLIFAIFSEVEQQPALAKQILLFINEKVNGEP